MLLNVLDQYAIWQTLRRILYSGTGSLQQLSRSFCKVLAGTTVLDPEETAILFDRDCAQRVCHHAMGDCLPQRIHVQCTWSHFAGGDRVAEQHNLSTVTVGEKNVSQRHRSYKWVRSRRASRIHLCVHPCGNEDEELLLIFDVPIQGGGLNLELTREPAHGQIA